MRKFIIRKTNKKGRGLFANRELEKDERILHVDLSKLKSYSKKAMDKDAKLQSDHGDYVGNGRYVISYHPYSYMNHSCNPNCLIKYRTLAVSDIYALRDIKKGEELTYDYGVNALDQFEKELWVMKCKCGCKRCRKKISGSFFKQPIKIQRFYYKYLPASIKRKYRKRLKRLR